MRRAAPPPGVISAGLGQPCAGVGRLQRNPDWISGSAEPPHRALSRVLGVVWASPSNLQTVHVPLLKGRWFTPADRVGSPKVMVVNEAAARTFWPGEDPVGHRATAGQGGYGGGGAEVIGVVGDVRYLQGRRAGAARRSCSLPAVATVWHAAVHPYHGRPRGIDRRCPPRGARAQSRPAAVRHPNYGRAYRRGDIEAAIHCDPAGSVRRNRPMPGGDRHLRRDVLPSDPTNARDRYPDWRWAHGAATCSRWSCAAERFWQRSESASERREHSPQAGRSRRYCTRFSRAIRQPTSRSEPSSQLWHWQPATCRHVAHRWSIRRERCGQSSADVNLPTDDGHSSLIAAAVDGPTKLVRSCKSHGADPESA